MYYDSFRYTIDNAYRTCIALDVSDSYLVPLLIRTLSVRREQTPNRKLKFSVAANNSYERFDCFQ